MEGSASCRRESIVTCSMEEQHGGEGEDPTLRPSYDGTSCPMALTTPPSTKPDRSPHTSVLTLATATNEEFSHECLAKLRSELTRAGGPKFQRMKMEEMYLAVCDASRSAWTREKAIETELRAAKKDIKRLVAEAEKSKRSYSEAAAVRERSAVAACRSQFTAELQRYKERMETRAELREGEIADTKAVVMTTHTDGMRDLAEVVRRIECSAARIDGVAMVLQTTPVKEEEEEDHHPSVPDDAHLRLQAALAAAQVTAMQANAQRAQHEIEILRCEKQDLLTALLQATAWRKKSSRWACCFGLE